MVHSKLLKALSHPPSDTIRKMKNDFKKMEDEMDCLSANMAAITDFSARITGTLQDQHTQITKLSGEPRLCSLMLVKPFLSV